MGIFRNVLNLGRWRGAQPNALVNGRVDVRVGAAADVSGIKSIQYGIFDVLSNVASGGTATITINAVNMSKSILIFVAMGFSVSTWTHTARLTSSTGITVTKNRPDTSTRPTYWTVLEFY